MAQVNIVHFNEFEDSEAAVFSYLVLQIVAKAIHGLDREQIVPSSATVLTLNVRPTASLSGADTELQVQVSGNDWPKHSGDEPYSAKEAKIYLDTMAGQIQTSLSALSKRKIYVWVTPFVASGWAE